MASFMTLCQFVYPKIALVTSRIVIPTKLSGQNSEIKENFPITIFFVVDGLVTFCRFWTLKFLFFHGRKINLSKPPV